MSHEFALVTCNSAGYILEVYMFFKLSVIDCKYASTQYPTPILNIPEVVAFLHVITGGRSRIGDNKRVWFENTLVFSRFTNVNLSIRIKVTRRKVKKWLLILYFCTKVKTQYITRKRRFYKAENQPFLPKRICLGLCRYDSQLRLILRMKFTQWNACIHCQHFFILNFMQTCRCTRRWQFTVLVECKIDLLLYSSSQILRQYFT